MSLKRFLLVRLGRLLTYPVRLQLRRVDESCQNPEAVQTELLFQILRAQADTQFARDHKFSAIKTVADYRNNVPVGPYEYVAPYIERVQKGETQALLADRRVLMFALTSGTSASRKLIPVTDAYLAAYRRGWNMWGVRMYRDHRPRRLFLRPIVQMVGDPDEYRTPAGIPCGNLSGYTAMVQKRIVRRLYAVPYQTGKLTSPLAKYYVALRSVLAKPVALFMAANPSTLLQLARVLDAEKEHLLRDLRDGTLRADLELPADLRAVVTAKLAAEPERAKALAFVADKTGRLLPADLWPPDTTLLATWTGGSMGPYLRQLPDSYGPRPVRDLGVSATDALYTNTF